RWPTCSRSPASGRRPRRRSRPHLPPTARADSRPSTSRPERCCRSRRRTTPVMAAAEGIDPAPEREKAPTVTNQPDQRPDPADERGALDTVVVTGLSGAGRSTAAKCLEDLGFFVVDNLPPELVATMVQLGSRTKGAVTRIAVVMDVR